MKVIACATVIDELNPLLPPHAEVVVLDFGLHTKPERLKSMLQKEIAATPPSAEVVALGYGMCSHAVLGLRSDTCTLVVPRVDDCIGIFLGSTTAYAKQRAAEPGTYYLTRGWVEAGDGPFAEYERMVERYGKEKADWVMGQILGRYTRLALIDTGQHEIDAYRTYVRQTADQFGLRYEEIQGSTALLRKMVEGPWDDDFVVAPPGRTITFSDFAPEASSRQTAKPPARRTADPLTSPTAPRDH